MFLFIRQHNAKFRKNRFREIKEKNMGKVNVTVLNK